MQNSFIILVLVFGLACVAFSQKLICGPEGYQIPNPATMKLLAECKDPNIWGTEEGKKNPNCDQLCISVALGYMGEDGRPSKDLYFKWIEADFLPQNQEFAKKHMSNCFEKHGSKIDLNDKTCTEIKNFDTCGWSMQPQLKC